MIYFQLSQKEEKSAKDWQKYHKGICTYRSFSYVFTPTGIGDAVYIRCDYCKKQKEITDYENW